ncbi:hypothetical protein DHEL01_v205860 [Diaporthe helianthi]|uniref:Uncharacterized protein n=1 Tax=Diaporthe helianthi TaxID=158607 RepID=A0A2P5HZQ7_DIAHE|nr:hypothetical protein DHEL01_v205860 [Diaporthe helianthi]
MQLKTVIPATLLAATATAQQVVIETIEGYVFEHSGPKDAAPQATYEIRGLKTANELLKTRMGLDPSTSDDLTELRDENRRLKAEYDADGLLELLAPDITSADAFWQDVIKGSTPGSWVSADARGAAFLPNLTALAFAAWSQSPLADEANNDVNGEHYFKRTVTKGRGVLASEILEGWGGVTTLFTIPDYASPPNRLQFPFLRLLPGFPFQAAGSKVLEDDSQFGALHISSRDIVGEAGKHGIEIYSTVWYGDAAEDDFLEAERQHMVTEIVKLSIQAQKDVESGRFTVPSMWEYSKAAGEGSIHKAEPFGLEAQFALGSN